MSRKSTAEWNAPRLAKLLKLSTDGLYDLRRRDVVPAPVAEEWDMEACVGAYVEFLRAKFTDSGKESKSRREEAEASIAEMKRGEMEGTLCLKSQCVADFEDLMTRGAVEIGRLKTLTTAQKESVLTILRELEPPSLEDEEIDEGTG